MSASLDFRLPRVRDPDPLGQPARRTCPGEPLPPLHPGDQGAARPRGPGADLPDGADRAGGLGRARDRDPRRGARDLQALAADAAAPRPAPRARARHPGAHLLQVRGRLAGRLAQAEHRRRAGLLQHARPGSRKLATETGAGQWGSALALACQLFGLECEVFMVGVSYDQKPYRRAMIETWGGDRAPQPLRPHRGRPLAGRARVRAASGSRSPRRSRSPRATRTPTTRSARCSTTSACTRR